MSREIRSEKPTILFVSESVTLAHLVRPAMLASVADEAVFDVRFAVDPRNIKRNFPWRGPTENIRSMQQDDFLSRLKDGRPVLDAKLLSSQVEEDLALFARTKPTMVVGDFRVSLAISSKLAKIPYANITNCYWTRLSKLAPPMPDHSLVKLLGSSWANRIFRLIYPMVYWDQARGFRRVAKSFGISMPGADIRDCYTAGDLVFFAEPTGLVPISTKPRHTHFLGPMTYSTND